MADGAANAELLRSIGCLSTHEKDESSSAHAMPSGWGLEGCHSGGGTYVCISWRNEDELETEINMIN